MKKWSWLVAPAIVLTLAAIPAHAAKKPTGAATSSNISIATIDGARLAAADSSPTPSLGDTLTFATTVGSISGWEYPMVSLSCYQGGTLVYVDLAKPADNFLLGGSASRWLANGGGAYCDAELDAYGWR